MSTAKKTPQSIDTSLDPALEYLNQRAVEFAATPTENSTKSVVFEEVTQIITNVFQINTPTGGGADGQLQFNQDGQYTGDAELQYDPYTDTLTTGRIVANSITITGNANNFRLAGGYNNEVLKTDGNGNLSWANVFPSVSGKSGKFLVTNGVSIDWSNGNYNSFATTSYVDSAIATLVGTAPAMLDTLAEIADVIGQTNDPQYGIISQLANKANVSSLAQVAFSGSYADLSNRPNISNVGISGNYTDLNGKPTIPATILDLGISDGTVGQVLTANGNGRYHFSTVSVGGGGANTGNISFSNTVIYSNTGAIINNSDLSNGQTAGLVIPAQGDVNTAALFNTYGNVTILTGNIGNSQPVQSWTFNPAGALFFPQTPYVTSAILVNDNNQELSVSTDRGSISIWPENSKWKFGADGNLTFPDLTEYTGQIIRPPVDGGLGISLNRNLELSAVAAVNSGEGQLYIDTSINDDTSVVDIFWQLNTGTFGVPVLNPVTSVITPTPGVRRISVSGVTFVVGETYTFRRDAIDSVDWLFQPDGVLRTSGLGTISHYPGLTSSLKLEVPAGNDIALRTAGGDWTFGDDGNLTLPGNAFAVNYANGTQVTLGDGGGNANTGNVTFDDLTVQGVNQLNLSAGADFTANLAYVRVRSGDVASHIHLDTGNNEAYDLIVGNDQKFVQVSSTGNIIMSSYDGNTSHIMTFGTDGNLTTPSNLVIGPGPGSGSSIFQYNEGLQILGEGANSVVQLGWTANTSAPDSVTTIAMNYPGGGEGNVLIAVGNNATTVNYWLFDNTGNLRLPGNTFAVNYANGTQVSLGGSSSNISNGNSNVSIATANGNVTIAAVGNTTMTVTGTGANITGTLTSTGKIGYASGSTVTQTTNRGNGVNINALAGTIVTVSASMTAGEIGAFTVTNNRVDTDNDIVLVQVVSPNLGNYNVIANPNSGVGGFYVTLQNISGFPISPEAVTIRFMVIKAPNA